MSEFSAIAHPYAQAAFDFAKASGNTSKWMEMLEICAIAAKDSQLEKFMSARGQSAAAKLVIDALGSKIDKFCGNLLKILAENERLQVMDDVVEQFKLIDDEDRKVMRVEVESADKLSAADETKLISYLENKYGRTVKMDVKIDPSLIAGIVIRTPNEVLDASARNRIQKLSDALR